MSQVQQAQVAPASVASDLSVSDLRAALAAGWRDFWAYPIYGLAVAAIYVVAGLYLTYALFARGEVAWLVPASAGFPLLAPFAAVALYEVSRRRELGLPMSWGAILSALSGRGDQQILSMGMIVFVAFGFWLIVAHGIFAIFLGEVGMGAQSIEPFLTPAGILMLMVGGALGGLMALAFYAITVMSLPMLVDRDVDFLTAIIVSLGAMRSNTFVLLVWAVVISVSLFIAMLPAFLGLFVMLPVLGHATWHLYRRAVTPAGA